ncbi:MAG: hypothetical protein VXY11_04930 [Candidatus Thermoplasmatota archaeon]|nr:hypothetical protein [Candidatus Thermoplasmatota archaeon]
MEFAWYSICLVLAFAFTRWFTENFKIHVRSERLWLHHWIMASIAMFGLLIANIDSLFVWGALTGIALEGLGRKNWSISRK